MTAPHKDWHPDKRSKRSGEASGRFLAGPLNYRLPAPLSAGIPTSEASAAAKRRDDSCRDHHLHRLTAPLSAGIPTSGESAAAKRRDDSAPQGLSSRQAKQAQQRSVGTIPVGTTIFTVCLRPSALSSRQAKQAQLQSVGTIPGGTTKTNQKPL